MPRYRVSSRPVDSAHICASAYSSIIANRRCYQALDKLSIGCANTLYKPSHLDIRLDRSISGRASIDAIRLTGIPSNPMPKHRVTDARKPQIHGHRVSHFRYQQNKHLASSPSNLHAILLTDKYLFNCSTPHSPPLTSYALQSHLRTTVNRKSLGPHNFAKTASSISPKQILLSQSSE
jgi:hypothetical protein